MIEIYQCYSCGAIFEEPEVREFIGFHRFNGCEQPPEFEAYCPLCGSQEFYEIEDSKEIDENY
jgi:Zn finger protein HypA/HybF involved in hydrogenase expression